MDDGGAVLCPPATSLSLQVNLPYISPSKIMCVPSYLNPSFNFPSLICSGVTPFKTSKYKRMLANLLFNWFFPKDIPRLLINFVCLVNHLMNLNPELICCSPVLWFDLWDNLVSFAKNTLHPQFKCRFILYVVCYCIYWASSTGFEGLIYLNIIHLKIPSFHSTSNFQTLVVFLSCRFKLQLPINPSLLLNTIPSSEWSLISFSTL